MIIVYKEMFYPTFVAGFIFSSHTEYITLLTKKPHIIASVKLGKWSDEYKFARDLH